MVQYRFLQYIGQHGVVKKVEDNGDVLVQYEGKEWTFNAAALRKVGVCLSL